MTSMLPHENRSQPQRPSHRSASPWAAIARRMPTVRRLALRVANQTPGTPAVGELTCCGWIALADLLATPLGRQTALQGSQGWEAPIRQAMVDRLAGGVQAQRWAQRGKRLWDEAAALARRNIGHLPGADEVAELAGLSADSGPMLVRYLQTYAAIGECRDRERAQVSPAQPSAPAPAWPPGGPAAPPETHPGVRRLGTTDSPRAKVLVVDDEPMIRRSFRRVLERAGYQADVAADGSEALEMVRRTEYAAVISDIAMPKLDGLSLLRALRKIYLDIPLILVTGASSTDSAIEALRYGATGYLPKPVDGKVLRGEVDRAVKLHEVAKVRRGTVDVLGSDGYQLGDRAAMEVSFERALAQLFMVFQPIVAWKRREVFGYEALVRSAEETIPHPGALFDSAERLGRVHQLGRAIRRLCAAAIPTMPPAAQLFVNLHPTDLEDPDLLDPAAPLTAHASRIILEITERAQLEQIDSVPKKLAPLRDFGFRIAVDDLGAGYSGLNSFATLEPEVVKLDMALVRDVDTSPQKLKLTAAMVSLCRDLDTVVVAEGIETPAERETLAKLGCDLFQGFLFAKPAQAFATPDWEG